VTWIYWEDIPLDAHMWLWALVEKKNKTRSHKSSSLFPFKKAWMVEGDQEKTVISLFLTWHCQKSRVRSKKMKCKIIYYLTEAVSLSESALPSPSTSLLVLPVHSFCFEHSWSWERAEVICQRRSSLVSATCLAAHVQPPQCSMREIHQLLLQLPLRSGWGFTGRFSLEQGFPVFSPRNW